LGSSDWRSEARREGAANDEEDNGKAKNEVDADFAKGINNDVFRKTANQRNLGRKITATSIFLGKNLAIFRRERFLGFEI
jgi:hypothetical protein